jgi:hypothetical protein
MAGDAWITHVDDVTGAAVASDRVGTGIATPQTDEVYGGVNDLYSITGSQVGGRSIVNFSRRVVTNNGCSNNCDVDINTNGDDVTISFAYGQSDTVGNWYAIQSYIDVICARKTLS